MSRAEEKILAHVEAVLRGELEEPIHDNLKVEQWFGRGGDQFHISLARVNTRTGYEKRIAIPKADIVAILAEVIRVYASFEDLVQGVKGGD